MRLVGLHFRPPLAIARLGGASLPLENFSWGTQRTLHGAHQTTISPEATLDVRADGSLLPYIPNAIEFRDGDDLRPVAPFFELWATLQDPRGHMAEKALTLGLLEKLGASSKHVRFSITVANRKAQRRTGSAACAFIARTVVGGDDHERKSLLAFSPHAPEETPLVSPERPIPLGFFQVIRPIQATLLSIDLSIARVRFTPAAGEVYGPPTAVCGPASPLPPGGALAPSTLGGRLHEIVPERNRILNAGTAWSSYAMDKETQDEPQPSDSYDGANVGNSQSWGVVDDTCDGVIEASVVVAGQRFTASTRVISACPDFAPDRRPFFSLADDLADRDLEPARAEDDIAESEAEIADLFQRVLETVSLVNLDSTRFHGIGENVSDPMPTNPEGVELPRIDDKSMTKDDVPYVDLVPALLEPAQESGNGGRPPRSRLAYSAVARAAHAPLSDVETLIWFLQSHRQHVERLIRPPFGRFKELAETPDEAPNPRYRDPRVARDALQDMRMPPYMRDSDETPLSLTHRQYGLLMGFLQEFPGRDGHGPMAERGTRPSSPLARRIADLAERVRASSEYRSAIGSTSDK
jgi:hypothetical protein